ncbi:MAG: hypothetical protein CMN30_18960 [Sandaracinus sp.]|nr:hypothetical protein [Sandaracinus sp.]|tara:strand:+ start:227 stop:601 length:375 start_codon:yes stop_codon:yes gene_type:complete
MMKRLLKTALLGTLGMVALGASGCVVVLDDYEPCDFDSDCDSGRCETVTVSWPDGSRVQDAFCTVGCFDDFDCQYTAAGLPGTCDSLGGGPFICWETCDFDSDCAPGWVCDVSRDGFDSYCLPY